MELLQFDADRLAKKRAEEKGKKLSPGSLPISEPFHGACHACRENVHAISPRTACSMHDVFLALPLASERTDKYLTWLNNAAHRSVTSD